MKRDEDKGQPCLTPLSILKKTARPTIIRDTAFYVSVKAFDPVNHAGTETKILKRFVMKEHSIVSKSFSNDVSFFGKADYTVLVECFYL